MKLIYKIFCMGIRDIYEGIKLYLGKEKEE